jgi:hypothetical protein
MQLKNKAILLLLPSRLLLFAFFQACISLVFYFSGETNSWNQSEGYWIVNGFLTNVVCFFMLYKLFKNQGKSYFENFRIEPHQWWKDFLITIVFLGISFPLTMYPNIFLAEHLLGSQEEAAHLFFRPLPSWVLLTGILWAISQGLVELPFYFKGVVRKLAKDENSWSAWFIASFFLAMQHITLPLIFNWGFIGWRFGMFLPFALFIGICLKIRPRLFPFLMFSHALMDIGAVIMLVYQ